MKTQLEYLLDSLEDIQNDFTMTKARLIGFIKDALETEKTDRANELYDADDYTNTYSGESKE